MKVFITKWTFTDGIVEVDNAEEIQGASGLIKFKMPHHNVFTYAYPKDYFFDKNAAIADCEKRRLKKITSLQKQIQKIKSIKF